jgi:O-antigen/teichoic acid export membrane protein
LSINSSLAPPPARPITPKASHWRFWLFTGLALAVLSLLFYFPTLRNPNHEPSTVNLLSDATGFSLVRADPLFYEDWAEAQYQFLDGQVPLWNTTGQQPLLELSQAPLLYPGSVLYYLGGPDFGPVAFALFHFWLLGMGLSGLARKLWPRSGSAQPPNWAAKGLAGAGIVFLLLLAGTLRPDWLAAFAWLPPALLLVYWRRRVLAFILLALPLGLMALCGPLPLTLALYAVVAAWWLGREVRWQHRNASQGLRGYIRASGYLILALMGGLFLAGPQLFPRLAYPGPAVKCCSPVGAATAEASGATINSFVRLNYGQWLVHFTIPKPPPDRVTSVIVCLKLDDKPAGDNSNMKASGWGGQLFAGDSTDKSARSGPDVKVVGASATGLQVATITFDTANPPQGTEYTLRLRYNPLAFTLGLYSAFLTVISLALLAAVVGWLRFYREDEHDHPLRRVIKNSATPLFAQLTGKVIDFAYAIFVLRLLGPDGNGQYTFAVTTWLLFATLSDFGLEGLVTREIARARQQPDADRVINRLFVTKFFLRLGFSVAALPLSLVWIAGFGLSGNLTAGTAWAIILLMIGFWPSALAGSITTIFRGYEKFEYLAAGQLLASIIKVPLGLAALLAGWGVVGLAAASVVVNFIQVAVLESLQNKQVFKPKLSLKYYDSALAKTLLAGAFPLMLNGLIINILFKSDGIFLAALRGDTELGLYNSAYKFIDALLIIPSTLTIALFPLFSVYGADKKENLLRVYREGLRLLLVIALPISAGTLFVAYDLISFLGGPAYLPGGAIALQILIWFLPFSYINGLTQYVLIAIDKQRSITWAVVAAAVVNIALNLVLIPFFGYKASSAITIVTELVLLGPFSWIMWRALGKGSVPLISTGWRPVLSAGVMLAALLGLAAAGLNQFVVTVIVGGLVYLAMLTVTRTVTREDLALLKKVLKR